MIPASNANQPPELRPRTLGEMLDAAMKIFGANFKSLFLMSAGLVLAIQVAISLLAISVVNSISDQIQPIDGRPFSLNDLKVTRGQIGALCATFALSILAQLVVTGALTWFIAQYYTRRKPTTKEAVVYALKQLPRLFALSIAQLLPVVGMVTVLILIIAGLGGGAGSTVVILAFVVAIIWLYVSLSLTIPALIVEHLGVFASMKRSMALVKKYWWKVCGTLVVTGLLTGVFSQVVQNLVSRVLNNLGGDNKGFQFVWLAVAGTLAAALTTPISAAMTTLLYTDLRIRKEGFDLEVLSSSLGDSPASVGSWKNSEPGSWP